MLPLMTAVQESCGRIGAVTGKGLAAVVRDHYGKKILFPLVLLVLFANIINIGADIGAMGAALRLLIPIPFTVAVIAFTVVILLVEIFTSYQTYSSVLKWMALALLAYPLTVVIVGQPWTTLLRSTVVPHIQLSFAFLFLITGVLGTTISPYMFIWQASQEVEEEEEQNRLRQHGRPRIGWAFVRRARTDTIIGMVASEFTAWCIIVVGATVLHAHGKTNVATAADAAKALEPLVASFPNAGFVSKLIFAVGIIGLGLLAVPVLSGSASFGVSEAFHWQSGFHNKLRRAPAFYAVIVIATVAGLLLNYVGIDPVKALIFTAVFNGVAAVPLLFFIAKISGNQEIMGKYRSGRLSRGLIWLTFAAMGLAALAMFVTLVPR